MRSEQKWYDSWSKLFMRTLAIIAFVVLVQWGIADYLNRTEILFNRGTMTIIILTLLIAAFVSVIAVIGRRSDAEESNGLLWGALGFIFILIAVFVVMEIFSKSPDWLANNAPALEKLPEVPKYPWDYLWAVWKINIFYPLALVGAAWSLWRTRK